MKFKVYDCVSAYPVRLGGKYKSRKMRLKAMRLFRKRCLGRHDIYALIAQNPNMYRPRNARKN